MILQRGKMSGYEGEEAGYLVMKRKYMSVVFNTEISTQSLANSNSASANYIKSYCDGFINLGIFPHAVADEEFTDIIRLLI